MVRKNKPLSGVKSNKKYEQETIDTAIKAIKDGLPIKKAAKPYQITYSVLPRKMTG